MGYWWMWKGGPNSSKDLHSEAREKLTSTDANISASWRRWMIFFRCIMMSWGFNNFCWMMGIQWFQCARYLNIGWWRSPRSPWNPDPLNIICVHKFKLRYSERCASNSRTPRKVLAHLLKIILYQCLKSTTLSPWYWSSLHSFYSSFRRFHSPSHPIFMIHTRWYSSTSSPTPSNPFQKFKYIQPIIQYFIS